MSNMPDAMKIVFLAGDKDEAEDTFTKRMEKVTSYARGAVMEGLWDRPYETRFRKEAHDAMDAAMDKLKTDYDLLAVRAKEYYRD